MVLILSIGNLISILLKPRESGKLVESKDFKKYRETKKQEQAEDEKKRKLVVLTLMKYFSARACQSGGIIRVVR